MIANQSHQRPPGRPRQPLDLLVEHAGDQRVSDGALACVVIALVVWSLLHLLDGHRRVVPLLFSFEFAAAGMVPLLYAMQSRILADVHRHRFLELTLLTGLTARDWSDGLVRQGLRQVLPRGLVSITAGLVVLTGLFDREAVPQTILWLPTVVCLMVVVAYFHQARGVMDVDRPGREMAQFIVTAPLLLLGLQVLTAWADQGPAGCIETLLGATAVLTGVRWFLLRRLEGVLSTGHQPDRSRGRAMQAWSSNLIVVRESWRSARRGGLLSVYLRRFAVFALFTAGMTWLVQDIGVGRGPWYIYYNDCADHILSVFIGYAWLGIPLVYWSTLSAVFSERHQQTAVLLESTPMTVREYLSGWVDWATRYRNLELLALYGVGLLGIVGCLWAEQGWDLARLSPGLIDTQVATLESAVGTGLATWIWMQCAAHVAILASARSRSWMAMQLDLLTWVVPYLLLAGLVGALPFPLLGQGVKVAVSLAFYRHARRLAQASLQHPGGELKLVS